MRVLLVLAATALLAGSAYGSKCGGQISPCQNGGQCFERPPGHRCECLAGFAGENCEIDINECANSPCRNGGTCREGNPNSYTCQCTEGWGGNDCEQNIACDSNPCYNNGDCVQGVIGYWCRCPASFTGVNCETEIFECDSQPCQNGGACQENGARPYECLCTAEYTGIHCEESLNACGENPCKYGSTCVNYGTEYRCYCARGYTGDDCDQEINECSSLPCQNGGRCTNTDDGGYECECTIAYTGTNCEELGLCDDIEGTWYNSCNDMVTITKTTSGMILGQYATWADRSAGYIDAECWSDPVGADYRGAVSVSRSGRICLEWTDQSVIPHTRTPEGFPNRGLGDHNYCRNPDGEPFGPWCYIDDEEQRWEYCDVPGPSASCNNDIPSIMVGYVSNNIERPSFGFTVVQNQGDSTTSWTGQCHWCDGQEVLVTTWIRTEISNHCWESKNSNKVGTDGWTRYQQSPAPAIAETAFQQDNGK